MSKLQSDAIWSSVVTSPPTLIVRRWFTEEQAALENLEAEVAALDQQIEEMAEEQGGDEGLLAEAANDKGKITKAGVLVVEEYNGHPVYGSAVNILIGEVFEAAL